MNDIAATYSKSFQGGELPYFVGKQYGSGWLKTLGRFAFPILKRIGKVAVNVASDYFTKSKPIVPSIKENALKAASEFLPSLFTTPAQAPKRHQTPKKSINKRRKLGIFKK